MGWEWGLDICSEFGGSGYALKKDGGRSASTLTLGWEGLSEAGSCADDIVKR